MAEKERLIFTPAKVPAIAPMKRLPCAVAGSFQVQPALPAALLECPEAGRGLPASLPLQERRPFTPLPVFAFLTVNETANAFPAAALPTVSLPAFGVGAAGGVVGGGGGAAALTVIVLVVEAPAPELSVTVSLTLNVPAAV